MKEQFFLIFTPRLDKDARVARCPECNPESMSSTSITVWLDPARDPAPMIGVLHASDKLLPSSAKATYQLINYFLQFKETLNNDKYIIILLQLISFFFNLFHLQTNRCASSAPDTWQTVPRSRTSFSRPPRVSKLFHAPSPHSSRSTRERWRSKRATSRGQVSSRSRS